MKRFALSLLCLLACALGLARPALADPITHVLWTNTDGRLSLWNYSDSGTFTQITYGPYAGWTAKALADGPDGRQRILWTNVSGAMSLWSLDNTTGKFTQNTYGPYAGWSATALSMASGGGSPTGTAGGDLFGLYPNPTIAPGAVDHTKLAPDMASLAQVSGGTLSTSISATTLSLQYGGGGRLTFTNNPNDNKIYMEGFSSDGSASASDMLITGQAGTNLPLFEVFANTTNFQGNAYIEGNVGIGTATPQTKLDVNGGVNATGDIHSNSNITSGAGVVAAGVISSGSNIFSNLGIIATGDIHAGGNFTTSGSVIANSLQLTGGSDLAEPYTIAASQNTLPLPGLVVAIDPAHTGQMRVCTRAYDTAVGGIISGAGGVSPGITLRQKGTVADGTLPIACTGRVWCWCDADAGGPITPGDLLTTSDTPGHAMRVRDYDKARGAILGKAMSPLQSGKGLVLVLVTLE